GAVQHGEDHVDIGVRAGLRQNGTGFPAAVLANQIAHHFVALGFQRGDNGFGRAQRDLMLATAASINHGYARFHIQRIFFPMAERMSSTASSAVRLTSSITGLTSTTSMESTLAESQAISITRWASLYVAPPRTGLPAPGPNA